MKAVMALVLMAATACAQNTLDSSRAGLFSATNYWGRDQREFQRQMNDGADAWFIRRNQGLAGCGTGTACPDKYSSDTMRTISFEP